MVMEMEIHWLWTADGGIYFSFSYDWPIFIISVNKNVLILDIFRFIN